MPTKLRKPIYRQAGDLVVRIDRDGVAIRGAGKRKWHRVTYEQILCLSPARSLLAETEHKIGSRIRDSLTTPPRKRKS